MQLNIDTGVQKIAIVRNGENVGDISVSLSDPALLTRLRTVSQKANDLLAESRMGEITDIDEMLDEAQRIDKEMRDLLDWAFSSPVSKLVFGDSFCFTTHNGVTAVEQFLSAIMPEIEKMFSAEIKAAEKRQGKYLEKYRK